MAEYKIGSYNMSFASDLGLNLTEVNVESVSFKPSEMSWLLENTTENPREFWNNASLKVEKF